MDLNDKNGQLSVAQFPFFNNVSNPLVWAFITVGMGCDFLPCGINGVTVATFNMHLAILINKP
jgi:hypothetical protein